MYRDKVLLSSGQNKVTQDHYLEFKMLCARVWAFTELPALNGRRALGIIFLFTCQKEKQEKTQENLLKSFWDIKFRLVL